MTEETVVGLLVKLKGRWSGKTEEKDLETTFICVMERRGGDSFIGPRETLFKLL